MSPQGTDELLTVAETAARLRLKPGTIYNWISQQHLTSADGAAGSAPTPYMKMRIN